MTDIQKLLHQDQENISQYKRGKISLEDFNLKASEIAEAFYALYSKSGFPTLNKAGEADYRAGITLALHQPLERLKEIYAEVKDGDAVTPADAAYMLDKILVLEGSEQLYGTQYHYKNEIPEPLPIKDPENVNERRKKVGLSSMEEYLNKARQ